MSLHGPKPTDADTARREARDLDGTLDEIRTSIENVSRMTVVPGGVLALLREAAEHVDLARNALGAIGAVTDEPS